MTKLLIVDDIEEKCVALPRGLHLAEAMDLEPEVVAFTWANLKRLRLDSKKSAEVKKKLMDDRRAELAARVDQYRIGDRKIKTQVVWAEDIHNWINRRAEGDYAAVVKTRHQSESLAHMSTDWHLLRGCPAPVLLVGRKKWKKGGGIIATVDLDTSNRTKRKLNVDVVLEARHYAAMFDLPLSVLAVIEVPTLLADLDLVDTKTWAKQRKEELQPVLEALAEETGLPTSTFKLKRGPVAKTIVSEASQQKAQLVVMGTVARKGVKAQVMGNTAEDVLTLLKSDTLTLKP
jgi:universal stress protein E